MASAAVTPWPGATVPTESELRQRMRAEGLSPYVWSNGAGDVYGVHTHTYHKVIYVARGSIRFDLPDEGRTLEMQAGDRLDLPPHTRHGAAVGPQGVVCLEAQRAG